jgi:hypothetical protein
VLRTTAGFETAMIFPSTSEITFVCISMITFI